MTTKKKSEWEKLYDLLKKDEIGFEDDGGPTSKIAHKLIDLRKNIGEIPSEYLEDRFFVSKILKYEFCLDKNDFPSIPKKFLNDKSLAMEVMKENYDSLYYFSDEIQNDRDVILTGMDSILDPIDFQFYYYRTRYYFPDREYRKKYMKIFNTDEEFALMFWKHSYFYKDILEYISPIFLNDRNFIIKALSLNGQFFKEISDKYSDDREVVIAAVSNFGKALEYVSDKLKKDKEVCITALLNASFASLYIDESLKNDRDICLAQLRGSGFWGINDEYRGLSDNYKCDEEFIITALEKNFSVFYSMPDKVKNDKNLIKKALMNPNIKSNIYKYLSNELKVDKDIALMAVKKSSALYGYSMPEEIRKDSEIALEVIRQTGDAHWFDIPNILKNDIEFLKQAVEIDKNILKRLSPDIKQQIKDKNDTKISKKVETDNLKENICKTTTNLNKDKKTITEKHNTKKEENLNNNETNVPQSIMDEVNKINNFYNGFEKHIGSITSYPKSDVIKTIKEDPFNYVCNNTMYQGNIDLFYDEDIVFTYIYYSESPILDFIPNELKKNPEFLLKYLKFRNDPYYFSKMKPKFKRDKDFVITSLLLIDEMDGYYVPKELKNDKDILNILEKKKANK